MNYSFDRLINIEQKLSKLKVKSIETIQTQTRRDKLSVINKRKSIGKLRKSENLRSKKFRELKNEFRELKHTYRHTASHTLAKLLMKKKKEENYDNGEKRNIVMRNKDKINNILLSEIIQSRMQ